MGDELRYKERWDFRRNEGDLHSSSDESNKPDSRKHKLVSSFMSNGNDETSDHTPTLPPQEILQEHHTAAGGPTKSKKRGPGSNKKRKIVKKDVSKEIKPVQGKSFGKVDRKRSRTKKCGEPPSTSMNGLKIFVESLVKDFQVAGEELLVWMRKEMHEMDSTRTKKDTSKVLAIAQMMKSRNNRESGLKLLADHTTRPSNVASGSKGEKSNGKSLVQSLKSQKVNGSSSNDQYRAENQEVELVHISDSDQSPHQTNLGPGGYNKWNSGYLAESFKSQRVADSSHSFRVSDQTHQQANIGAGLKLNNYNGGFVSHSSNPQHVADSNHQYKVAEKRVETDRLASSMHFTLAGVMHKPGVKPQMSSSSSTYNLHTHPGLSVANTEVRNKASQRGVHELVANPQKVSWSAYSNAHPDVSAANTDSSTLTQQTTQRQYFLGMQKEERGGQNVNFLGQQNIQGLDRRFAGPNEVGSAEKQQSSNINVLGGSMRDEGLLNNQSQGMNYLSRLMAYQNQNMKGGTSAQK